MRILLIISCLLPLHLFAAPFLGQIKTFSQPDGSRVDIRLFGTELYMRAEGLDGYTLIREEKNGWICYAALNKNGTALVSTGRKYAGREGKPETLKKWTDLPTGLEIPEKEREKLIRERALSVSGNDPFHLRHSSAPFGTPVFPVNGQIKGLCILIDFPDEPSTLPASEYASFCNDTNYSNFGNNGSLRSYFRDVSKGKVDYTNQVAGFFRAPNTFAYYDALPYAHGAQQLLTWALEKLDSAGFDFSSLSLNSENNSIMAINLMYTGEPPTWAQGMWFHKGYLNTFTSSSGIKAGDYNCSPAKAPLGIGVVAHENGHMIGKWPDTYKYNQNTGPDGIGAFDLMCWYGSSQNPVPPNPLFRLNAGWGKNFDISNLSGQVTDTANLGNIRSFRNDNDTNEFYLLEAREEEGRSFYIPDRGLTIWRINRLGDNQTLNHEVTLIPAGNDVNNMTNACFRAGFKPTFNQSTSPSSRWRNGDPSGLKLSNISTPGSTMTYNAGQGTNAAILKLLYKGISYDDNGNGQIEPGETIRFEMKVLNTGGNPSGAVSVSCTGIAPFTNYYTISNPAQNFPILNSGQEFTMEFQIQVISSAVAGNQITLRFQVQENGNTLYVTRKFLVGSFLNMVSGIDSLCNYLYFDPGGLNPYTNNTFITQTLYPKNPASALKAEFLSFDLESEANCQYDFLQVFNGPTPSFPQFGKFCGTNSPGTIVSTHPGGALTFRFKADEGVTGDGWLARITCVPFTETSGRDPAADWQPYPNPAGEEIFLPAFSVPVDVQLLDMRGRVCLRLKTEVGQLGKLPVTGLEGGLYLLKASAASMQKIMKWSVFHR